MTETNTASDSDRMIDAAIRAVAVGGVVGGVALAGAYLAHPPSAPPEVVASPLWILVHVGFMASLLGGVFLLIALLTRYVQAGGGLVGLVGFAMAITSLVFVFGLDYAEVFIFPTLAIEFPEVVTKYGDGTMMPSLSFAFPLTGLMFLAGFVLFGWQLGKVGAVSRNASIATVIGTVVFGAGLSGFLPMVVVRVGSVLFGIGLILLSLDLWKLPTKRPAV